MADRAEDGQPEPQIENAVKQAPPEVEIVVDAVSAEPIPSQEAERLKEDEQVADEVSEKEQLKQRELDEVDGVGSSIPAKYAEAVLAVDDSKGTEVKAITNESDKTKPPRPKPASLIKLFRYATLLDWLLMLVGSILAVCHGVALPLLMLVFGDLTNAFINRDISQQLAGLSNGTIDCSLTFPPIFHNFTVAQFLDATNMSAGVDCSYILTPSSTINDFVVNCFQDEARCLTNGEFIGVVNIQVFYFLGIAAAVFICAYFQISLFQTACERQVHKIRLCFYHAILKQEIGWFDANPSGELSSRLSE